MTSASTEGRSAANPTPSKILVVVHPGSACGSADFHHGSEMASSERAMLAHCIRTWVGPIVVVDSDLTDEISGEPVLFDAIEKAITGNAALGHQADRILQHDDMEDDDDARRWPSKVAQHVSGKGYERAIVTGAWYHPDDDAGCVNAVHDELTKVGIHSDVHDSALCIDID